MFHSNGLIIINSIFVTAESIRIIILKPPLVRLKVISLASRVCVSSLGVHGLDVSVFKTVAGKWSGNCRYKTSIYPSRAQDFSVNRRKIISKNENFTNKVAFSSIMVSGNMSEFHFRSMMFPGTFMKPTMTLTVF